MTVAMTLLLALGIQVSPQSVPQRFECEASVRGDPDPQLWLRQWLIGPNGAQSYSADGVLIPQPVPLGLKVENDQDAVHRFCNLKCSIAEENIPGDWSASWSVQAGQGGFVNLAGEVDQFVSDGDAVLYLPPQDLDYGETRLFDINADVYDLYTGPYLEDGALRLQFRVSVIRATTGLYYVSIIPGSMESAGMVPTYCFPPYNPCCGLISAGTVPQEPITAYLLGPQAMTLGEIRPFSMAAYDVDAYKIECVHTVPPCLPASDYAELEYLDSTDYHWGLVPPPAGYLPVGDGEFLFQPAAPLIGAGTPTVRTGTRTGLFAATKSGYVSIRATVVGSDGETLVVPDAQNNEPPFIVQISSPRVIQLDMLGPLQTLKDSDSMPYPTEAAWLDLNGDGDAEDDGEHRFPVSSYINGGLHIPQVILAGEDLPKRRMVVKGVGPDNGSQQTMFYLGVSELHGAGNQVKVYGLDGDPNGSPMAPSTDSLPPKAVNFADKVQAYDPYQITWMLHLGGADACGQRSNRQ